MNPKVRYDWAEWIGWITRFCFLFVLGCALVWLGIRAWDWEIDHRIEEVRNVGR